MASVDDYKTFHPFKSSNLLRVFEPAHCRRVSEISGQKKLKQKFINRGGTRHGVGCVRGNCRRNRSGCHPDIFSQNLRHCPNSRG